jgi:hypothetical protein
MISRVMGIILATIALDAILGGFDTLDIFDVALSKTPACCSTRQSKVRYATGSFFSSSTHRTS